MFHVQNLTFDLTLHFKFKYYRHFSAKLILTYTLHIYIYVLLQMYEIHQFFLKLIFNSFILERMSSSGFTHYRDASSSSLTTGSGSSLASSTGGLHMNVPMTPLTPIPVMITSPDGSLRRESMQSMQTDAKQPIFYTQNEVLNTYKFWPLN